MCIRRLSTAECSAGKYYWKEVDPTEFYACVEPTSGVNPMLPDYVVNAVKMRCSAGSYMCTRYDDVSDRFCYNVYNLYGVHKNGQFCFLA